MGLSYNQAKGLVEKGRKKKDGGSTVLEKFMPIEIVPKRKTDRARSKTRMKDKMDPTPRQKEKEKQAKQPIKKQKGGGFDLGKEIKKIEALDKTPGGKAMKELMLKMIKDSKKAKPIKKANGGLKPIPDDNPGLKALKKERPDVVAKMGFKKKGGTLSFEMGGMNDMEDGSYMAKIESLQIVPTKKNKERPRPGRSQRGPAKGGVPSRKRRSMKEAKGMMGGGTYNMMPRKMSKGGVARGTGAAVKGTGFKGVY